MTLILSNEEIGELLTIDMAIDAVEDAQIALADKRAISSPRVDTLSPATNKSIDGTYGLKMMNGVYPEREAAVLRINSDVLYWPEVAGNVRRDRLPNKEGRWNGLVLLFSTETGEPLMISPDGYISRFRVGATNGLGARCLSREDAKVLALMGTGWQAGGQLRALCAVRDIEEVRIFSPTEEHRKKFCEEHQPFLNAKLVAVSSPEEAIENADIIASATNSMEPIFKDSWIRPGVHFSAVKVQEVALPFMEAMDVVGLFSKDPRTTRPQFHMMESVADTPQKVSGWLGWWVQRELPVWDRILELPDLLTGKTIGREGDEQTTLFVNNVGQGLQFAAVAKKVYDAAVEKKVGKEFPTEWFTQDVHP